MRYMGEVLSETALRSVFECRCEDPGVFVLRDSAGTPLGDIGLRISAKKTRTRPTSATRYCRKRRVRGYASEALRAICDYGFTTLGIHAINARVLGNNLGSSRLLEKNGFVRIQVLEKCLPPQRRGLR